MGATPKTGFGVSPVDFVERQSGQAAPHSDALARSRQFLWKSCLQHGATKAPPRAACAESKKPTSSNWTLLQHKNSVLGVNCATTRKETQRNFCSNSVNIDWWWAGDAALADNFGQTFDSFAHYSTLIREALGFHNSAPHHCE